MNLPYELQQWLNLADRKLDNLETFETVTRYRFPIYAFFDALPELRGRMARTILGLKALYRVLPLWGKENGIMEGGYETMPMLMCYGAEQMLAAMKEGKVQSELHTIAHQITVEVDSGTIAKPGEISTASLNHLFELACEMDSLTGESPNSLYWLDWCVFMTALNTLGESLRNSQSVDSHTLEVGVWGGDPAKWAAIAYGGGNWSGSVSPDEYDFSPQGIWDYTSPEVAKRRREFWTWWFRELVPETYFSLLK